jgi:hypothetical protein
MTQIAGAARPERPTGVTTGRLPLGLRKERAAGSETVSGAGANKNGEVANVCYASAHPAFPGPLECCAPVNIQRCAKP